VNLRDALADALARLYWSEAWLDSKAPEDADAILSDPAFRAALTDAIANELSVHRYGEDSEGVYGEWCGCEEWNERKTPWHEHAAAAVVAGMLT
jgi:hypothetical protein